MSKPKLLFHAGGECLTRYGTLVRRTRLEEDVAEVFTRSGAVGTAVDRYGRLIGHAANVPRVSHPLVDGVRSPAYLGEAARTNLMIRSEEFDTWTEIGTCAVTVNAIAAPDGTTTADLLTASTTTSARGRGMTFTGDGEKSAALFMKAGTSTRSTIVIRDVTASTDRHRVTVTWTGGIPSLGTSLGGGTLYGVEALANGWYRVRISATGIVAANTHQYQIYPESQSPGTGTVYVWGAQAEDAIAPSSYIATTTAAATRSAETFYAPYTHAPQEMTVYVKFVERGTDLITNAGIVHIGGTGSGSDPRLQIHAQGSGGYSFRYDDGTVNAAASTTSSIPHGSVVEIVGQLTASGATIYQSVDGATATTATQAASFTFPAAFNDSRIYIGSRGTSERGFADHISLKVAAGTKTLAEMRNA